MAARSAGSLRITLLTHGNHSSVAEGEARRSEASEKALIVLHVKGFLPFTLPNRNGSRLLRSYGSRSLRRH